jgi:hypothetical protein
MSGVIHTDEVKHQLGDVDPEYAYFLCRRTRLLVVHGGPRCRNHAGSSKPYWKEAGPLHYNPFASSSSIPKLYGSPHHLLRADLAPVQHEALLCPRIPSGDETPIVWMTLSFLDGIRCDAYIPLQTV